MEIDRGVVVTHLAMNNLRGVVAEFNANRAIVIWFTNDLTMKETVSLLSISPVPNQADYAFEAALYLGDTAKALELYRAEKKRMDGWQEHFQPLIDQYGAAEIAWIAGNIAAMVATGQFTPEDAIRHWQRPQAIFYGETLAPKWVTDLERRFVHTFYEKLKWPPQKWWVEGMRLVSARQQLDALTGGLSDAEWQEILDYCQDVAFDSADLDVFWKELAMWETHAKHVGGSKALMFDILRRAKGNG